MGLERVNIQGSVRSRELEINYFNMDTGFRAVEFL